MPVEIDFQALLYSEEGTQIRKNPLRAGKFLKTLIYPMMQDAFGQFYKLIQHSDKVLFHTKTLADNFADQFPGKLIKADLVPATYPTSSFPNPMFSFFLYLPAFFNRYTYKLSELGLTMWKKPIRDFRLSVGLSAKFEKPDLPAIYGISEIFLKRPHDYSPRTYFTGFWFDPSRNRLSEDLLDFIVSGKPPLLVTFGSMPFDSKINLSELINEVSRSLDTRIILVKGWGLYDSTSLLGNPNVKLIDSAPFDQLLPLVKAVVHHGGIGTTAECLRAGKPFLVCPILHPFGDQFFWGRLASKLGVALYPQPLKKMSLKSFTTKIGQLLNDEALYLTARKFADVLSEEDGLKNAIDFIERN